MKNITDLMYKIMTSLIYTFIALAIISLVSVLLAFIIMKVY